jgi:hypothetical protein
MMSSPSKTGWRALLCLATAASLVLAVAILPAAAASNNSEKAKSGLTKAERLARMQAINADVSTRLPKGHANAPVFVDITQEDRDAVDNPVITDRAPLRIGVVKQIKGTIGKPVGGTAFKPGVLEQRGDGSFVWAMTIKSPGAQGIRLHLEDFSLPSNVELFLLGANGQADGPHVGLGRNGDGDFWTRSIVGDTGTVVLRYTGTQPEINKGRTAFVITELAHVRGRPPRTTYQNHDSWPCSDNASCVVDAQCGSTGPAAPAEDAVAKLEWTQGPFINTCTGGLIADTDGGSQIAYMLTANHCFSADLSNLETFFNYTTTSCNGGCPDSLVTGGTPPASDTVGMTVNASGSDGDYTLMTLNGSPPSGAVYLGWTTNAVANTDGAPLHRISNANFGPQVYSAHSVDTDTPICTGIPRGAWIYSQDTTGATMGGSSGSPVVNGSGQIVGQLTGCCGFDCADICASPGTNWTIDGALAHYFADVAQFLDPQGGGCSTDAECNDGQFCTGAETCVSGSCQSAGDPCSGGTTCNEATDTCDASACDNDGACEAGEDCNNCPNDCGSKVSGNPNSRYCCDGDLPDCGDSRCNESGFSCGGGTTCSSDPECDDGAFCNGAETCSGGSCASGADPCPGMGCDEGANQCVSCGGNKATCSANSDCCSNNCKNGSCKGN